MGRTAPAETIAAQATAPGRGGLAVIRISGSLARAIGEALTQKKLAPRMATYGHFKSPQGEIIDDGIAIYFPGPASFTGEDVVELQGHGNPYVVDRLLTAVLAMGGRMARPGEFSERAFLNNKMDLAQAEAISDLIAAESLIAARSALASLQGAFSREINVLVETLIALRTYIEAALDFPEEEVDFLTRGNIENKLLGLQTQLVNVSSEAQQGSLLTEGMTLVIAGKPNAGKSSLLNALAGNELAIVTSVAGTTRDVLRAQIQIDGVPLHVVDTAGLRPSTDPIELEGIRRALQEIQKADRILLVVDACTNEIDTLEKVWPRDFCELPSSVPVTTIFNKCDLSGMPPSQGENQLVLSAKTGAGMDLLKKHLKNAMGYQDGSAGRFSARRRHLQSLEIAGHHLSQALFELRQKNGGELVAEELRLAQQALEVITGRFTPDDLLDKIFREFCIGK